MHGDSPIRIMLSLIIALESHELVLNSVYTIQTKPLNSVIFEPMFLSFSFIKVDIDSYFPIFVYYYLYYYIDDFFDIISELDVVPQLDRGLASSPIWDKNIRDDVTNSKLTTCQLNQLKSQILVPGKSFLFYRYNKQKFLVSMGKFNSSNFIQVF